jgi:hypothetical protein
MTMPITPFYAAVLGLIWNLCALPAYVLGAVLGFAAEAGI